MGSEGSAKRSSNIVGVKEFFFCFINRVVMLKVMAMKPLDYTRVILKVNNYNTKCPGNEAV